MICSNEDARHVQFLVIVITGDRRLHLQQSTKCDNHVTHFDQVWCGYLFGQRIVCILDQTKTRGTTWKGTKKAANARVSGRSVVSALCSTLTKGSLKK